MIKVYAFFYWLFLSAKDKVEDAVSDLRMRYVTRNMTLREKLTYLHSVACEGEMDQASYVLKGLCDTLLRDIPREKEVSDER